VQTRATTVIGHNAFVRGNVSGRFQIGGDLHTLPGTSVDPATTVAGRTVRETVPIDPPCPCSPSDLVDIAGLVSWGATHNDNATLMGFDPAAWAAGAGPSRMVLPCGRYYVTGIQSSGLTIRAEGRVVLFVGADIRASSGLSIEIAPGAEL